MRKEKRRIGRCLDSIVKSTYPLANCEVLVVDGASSDCSRSIALEMLKDLPSARLLHNPKMQVPAGLNVAIREARGRFVLRMDAHCEY